MKHRVHLEFDLPATMDGGDVVELLTDHGTGTIDTANPLSRTGAAAFAGEVNRIAPVSRTNIHARRKTAYPAPTPGVKRHEREPNLVSSQQSDTIPASAYIPPAVGTYKFAGRVKDAFGNQQTGSLETRTVFVSAMTPAPVSDFKLASYSGGKATFSYSRNLG